MKNLLEVITNEYNLSLLQKNQYLIYINFLLEENKKYNLTNIITEEQVLHYHVIDTLMITKSSFLNKKDTIADIGSGCGVPGIILAIFYPHKYFYLIEVTQKKIFFLNQAIDRLGLTNCEVISDDFLTFIRKKNIYINTFTARASLSLKDIIQIYQSDFYKTSEIIYWGSSKWKEDPKHNIILKSKLIKIDTFFYEIKENNNIRKLNYIHISKN